MSDEQFARATILEETIEPKAKMDDNKPEDAVARYVSRVQARINDRVELMHSIKPYLVTWFSRKKQASKRHQETLPDIDFDKVTGWDELIAELGLLYQFEGQTRPIQVENRAMLAYVWRLTFETKFFETGQKERDRLALAFGLVNEQTGETNKSELKRLKAMHHRPLCVAQSILLGEVSFKRDGVVASFVKRVIEIGYKVDGKPINHAYVNRWIEDNWDEIKDKANIVDMISFWERAGHSEITNDSVRPVGSDLQVELYPAGTRTDFPMLVLVSRTTDAEIPIALSDVQSLLHALSEAALDLL